MHKILVVIISMMLFACSSNVKRYSPTIYFSNASAKDITNIQSNWAGQKTLSLGKLLPGDTRSQTFELKSKEDFFGEVWVSWSNEKGERITREFLFNKNNLPSIDDQTTYSYVQFYLDQEEFEILSSDAPDLPGKIRKMDRLLRRYKFKSYKDKGIEYHGDSLIVLEAREDKTGNLSIWDTLVR